MSRQASELRPLTDRLAPYARESFARAAALAARLHAEEISPEHWLAALLEDESCAATRIVLHAFADPETIGVEVLALCAGIMVVGSGRTLPFSVLGVAALRAARARAAERGAGQVEPAELFQTAAAHLADELRSRLALVPGVELSPPVPAAPADAIVPATGPLFRHFAPGALRALGASCKAAASLERAAIGPLHIALGTLEVDEHLCQRTGLTPARLRLVSSGLDEDATPLPERRIPGDARLLALLGELRPGAGTTEVLGWLLEHGTEELALLLRRQKVTPALFERCRGVYRDPPGAGED